MLDSYYNNVITTLVSGCGPTDTTFTFASGNIIPYPPSLFTFLIDSEIIQVQPPSGTVVRGAEGTTATSHAAGARVTAILSAGMLNHLWQNVADRFNPDVPYTTTFGSTFYAQNDEFETNLGNFTLTPTDGGSSFTYSTPYYSWGTFTRSGVSTTTYYLYQSLSATNSVFQTVIAGGPFTATCSLRQGGRPFSNYTTTCWFFVSDQTTPTASLYSGNRLLIGSALDQAYSQTVILPDGTTTVIVQPTVQARVSKSGTVDVTQSVNILDIGYDYLRIIFDGTSVWTLQASTDGVAFHTLQQSTVAMTPATAGFAFTASGASPLQNVMIDFVRYTNP